MRANNLYPRFSEAEYARRYTDVRGAMREADIAALVLYGTVSAYNEVLYLANFITAREAMLVFPGEGEPTLFVQYFNHVPNARQVASIADVRWGGPDSAVAVADNLLERGLAQQRIGLVGAMSYKQLDMLRKMLPQAVLVDFAPQMGRLRLIKSEEEIEFLRKGAEFSDLAIEALEREVRPGMREY